MTFTKVTTEGIADSAVSTAKIGANAVDTSKIGADVIVADDIAANAITVAEISDGAITHAKLHSTTLNPITLDQSNNRVGVGVTSPSRKLELNNGGTGSFVTFTDGVATNFTFKTDGNQVGTFGTEAGSTHLAFMASGTERMRIHSAGYITTPNQPMARLSLGSHFGVSNVHPSSPGAKITGFTVHENVGNHWNNTNSEFTCPVAGVYLVSIFFIKYPASGAAHVDLHKNNSHVTGIRWRAPEAGNHYYQAGGSVFVTCAVNDVLNWKYFGAPGIHDGNGQWGIMLLG